MKRLRAVNKDRKQPFNYYTTRRENDDRLRTAGVKSDVSSSNDESKRCDNSQRDDVLSGKSDRQGIGMGPFDEAQAFFFEEAKESIARDLARYYSDKSEFFPVRQTRRYTGPAMVDPICPYCGRPYSYPFCRPVAKVYDGPKHFDFPASTVVDANPNRAELTE